jgi:hypothetical protein
LRKIASWPSDESWGNDKLAQRLLSLDRTDAANTKVAEGESAEDQIVRDERGASSLTEEGKYILASFNERVSVDSDVDKGPSVEVFDDFTKAINYTLPVS